MKEIAGYEIIKTPYPEQIPILLRVVEGNKEEIVTSKVDDKFFEHVTKDEMLELFTELLNEKV